MTCELCDQPADAAVCPACLGRVQRALVDVPDLVADLEATAYRQTAGARGVSAQLADHERALPFLDGPRIDEARRAVALLESWAQHIGGAGRGARDSSLELLAAGAWFRTDADAPIAARAILQIRAALRRAVDRPPARVIYAGPCRAEITTLAVDHDGDVLTPRLEVETCRGDVYAEPGNPLALCRECRVVHHVAERHAFTLDAALTAEALPLAEIIAALPALIGRRPDPATVRQWRHRGKLRPVVNLVRGDTRERYRVDDVLRLARDAETRPGSQRKDRISA